MATTYTKDNEHLEEISGFILILSRVMIQVTHEKKVLWKCLPPWQKPNEQRKQWAWTSCNPHIPSQRLETSSIVTVSVLLDTSNEIHICIMTELYIAIARLS